MPPRESPILKALPRHLAAHAWPPDPPPACLPAGPCGSSAGGWGRPEHPGGVAVGGVSQSRRAAPPCTTASTLRSLHARPTALPLLQGPARGHEEVPRRDGHPPAPLHAKHPAGVDGVGGGGIHAHCCTGVCHHEGPGRGDAHAARPAGRPQWVRSSSCLPCLPPTLPAGDAARPAARILSSRGPAQLSASRPLVCLQSRRTHPLLVCHDKRV